MPLGTWAAIRQQNVDTTGRVNSALGLGCALELAKGTRIRPSAWQLTRTPIARPFEHVEVGRLPALHE